MLEFYFKYRGVLRRLRDGALGNEMDRIAAHFSDLGYFQHSFAVYDREGLPCLRPRCRGVIRRATHAGRSTFWCPVCQR